MVRLFNKAPKRRNNFIRKAPAEYKGRGASFRPSGTKPAPARGGWQPLQLDKRIAFITFAFVLFGLIFTYSSSAFDSTAYFKRQILFDTLGIAAALFLSQTYDKLQKLKIFSPMNLMYVTWVLLIVVLFTRAQANVHRWIDFGFFKLQPSEIAKVTLVIYIADYLNGVSGKLTKNWRLLIKPMAVAGITLGLILAEKDIGTPTLMGAVFVFMLLVAGARLKHLAVPAVVLAPLAIQQLFFVSYRRERIFSFLDPFATAGSSGYQLVQSLLAFGSGGFFGVGVGASRQKMFYLPESHNDFIMSVLAEELGFVGVTVVMLLFALLFWRCYRVIMGQQNLRDRLTSFGITCIIAMGAVMNLAVVMGVAPPKGVPMPFLSYGGSNLVATLLCVGLLLNFSRTARE